MIFIRYLIMLDSLAPLLQRELRLRFMTFYRSSNAVVVYNGFKRIIIYIWNILGIARKCGEIRNYTKLTLYTIKVYGAFCSLIVKRRHQYNMNLKQGKPKKLK